MSYVGFPDGAHQSHSSRGNQQYGSTSRDHHSPAVGPSGQHTGPSSSTNPMGSGETQFDIFDWHPAYASCQRYFLDHAQHDGSVQAVAALVNIRLPFQWSLDPVPSAATIPLGATGPGAYQQAWPRGPASHGRQATPWVSLVPYIRRLVVTGFDTEGVLHGFFGDDWRKGIGPVQECERRNYMFAAKSAGWAKVKDQYDMGPMESVPFLRPLQNVHVEEIESAEREWSRFLCMQDWMLGPR